MKIMMSYIQLLDQTLIQLIFSYNDSTEIQGGGKNSFMRHSLRPKIKYKFLDGNVIFDYRFYYKPKVDDFEDYLLEHELKISMVTFYEAIIM